MLRLLFVLCAFAVLGAQVFGVTRGFMCDCGGLAKIVAVDHCHGSHGADCHEDEMAFPHEHHDEDESDRHDHAQVKGDFNGLSHLVPHFVVAAPIVLAPSWEQLFPIPSTLVSRIFGYGPEASCGSPPRIALSRTIVLRI